MENQDSQDQLAMVAEHTKRVDFRLGDWIIRPQRDCIERDGEVVRLAPKAMSVLECLVRASGTVVSREMLFDQVWPGGAVTDDALTQRIVELRKALGDSARNPRFIETIPKVGFRLIPHSEPLVDEPVAVEPTAVEPQSTDSERSRPAGTKLPVRAMFWTAAVIVVAALFFFLVMPWLESPKATVREDAVTIAVLPFVNVSDDREQAYFSDGITIEILNTLSKIPDLGVVSRSSSFSLKGKDLDIPSIARQLGVSHVLEGAVRKAGDRVRITTRLVDAQSDQQLWTETFDREYSMASLFDIQTEVAGSVVQALQDRLPLGDSKIPGAMPTENMAAFEAFLLARQRANHRSRQKYSEAIEYLQEAVSLDPGFTLAWAELAKVYLRQNYYFAYLGGGAIERAGFAVRKAMQLNENLSEVQAVLGLLRHFEGELDAAALAYDRALELNLNNVDAYLWKAALLREQDQWDEALANYQTALRLDPLSIPVRMSLASYHQHFGQFDSSRAQYDRVLEIDSADFQVWSWIGSLEHGVYNRLDEAISAYGHSLILEPNFVESYIMMGLAYLDLDAPGQARTILDLLYDNTLSMEPARRHSALLEVYEGNMEAAAGLVRGAPRRYGSGAFLYQIYIAQLRNYLLADDRKQEALELYQQTFPELFDDAAYDVDLDNYRAAIDLALVLRANGDEKGAANLLENAASFLDGRFRLGIQEGYWVSDVQILALQGKPEEAIVALKSAVEEGWRILWWYYMQLDPNLQAIRENPEFQALTEAISMDAATQMSRVYQSEYESERQAEPFGTNRIIY